MLGTAGSMCRLACEYVTCGKKGSLIWTRIKSRLARKAP